MYRKILLAVAALMILLLLVVATRPAHFRLERSIVVEESARSLTEYVSDFHKWDAWSPWARLDPAMKTDFQGTPGKEGSSYHWVGNDKVGEGRMTLLAPGGARQVRIKLEFLKPWKSTTETTFDFQPSGAGTRVVWAMSGDYDFTGKAMSLFMDMDKMVGPDFEKGLAQLKKGAEEGTIPR